MVFHCPPTKLRFVESLGQQLPKLLCQRCLSALLVSLESLAKPYPTNCLTKQGSEENRLKQQQASDTSEGISNPCLQHKDSKMTQYNFLLILYFGGKTSRDRLERQRARRATPQNGDATCQLPRCFSIAPVTSLRPNNSPLAKGLIGSYSSFMLLQHICSFHTHHNS